MSAPPQSLAGKYLTFSLAEESFGLEILEVREIIGVIDVTAVPCTPVHIKGVINLRGKVIPVVDLRLQFGMEEVEATSASCIIVVQLGEQAVGVLVDRVSEVMDITDSAIEPPPTFGQGIETDFIQGMGKTDKGVAILLDIHRVLTESDVESFVGTV